ADNPKLAEEDKLETKIAVVIKSEALKGISTAVPEFMMLLDNAKSKQRLEFGRKLHDQRVLLVDKTKGAQLKMNNSSNDLKDAVQSFESMCNQQVLASEMKLNLLRGKEIILHDTMNALIIQAQINMCKGIAYVVSAPSTLATAYIRLKG
ncbi:unnamed protein product, partial [Urochloa humidicola]